MEKERKLAAVQARLGEPRRKFPAKDEYGFICPGRPGNPCPSSSRGKVKLWVNVRADWFHCWVCGFSGRSLAGVMVQGSRDLQEYLGQGPANVAPVIEKGICRDLPPEYRPFRFDSSLDETLPLSYLFRRGVTKEQIQLYRMGYATSGDYRDHVVIPSFDAKGDVNCFVARSIHGPGYMMPDSTKDVIVNEHMVDWSRELVLVEGIFDAIAVGSQGIPLFGKSLLPKLMAKLIESRQTVHVCLDRDARAEAWNLAIELLEHGIVCSVPRVWGERTTDKDPASIGHDLSWKCIRRAELIKDSGYARIARYW